MRIKKLQTDHFTIKPNGANLIYVEDREEHFSESIKTLFGMDGYANRIPNMSVLTIFEKENVEFVAGLEYRSYLECFNDNPSKEWGISDVYEYRKSFRCLSTEKISYGGTANWQYWSLRCSPYESDQDVLLYTNRSRLRYTAMIMDSYQMLEELQKTEKAVTENKRAREYYCSATSAIRSFVDAYVPLDFGFFKLVFSELDLCIKPRSKKADLAELKGLSPEEAAQYKKTSNYLRHPEKWSKGQWNMVCLWDYIIANQIEQAIHEEMGCDDNPPLFLTDAFIDMENVDSKGYLDALRALDRQVFIIQTHDNPYVRQNCDQIVVV